VSGFTSWATTGWLARRRHAVLLVTLFATLVVAPLSEALHFGAGLIQLLLAVNLVAAVAAISERPAIRRPLLVLATLMLGRNLLPEHLVPTWLGEAGDLVWVVIAALAAAATVRFALRASVVDSEHIAAALSAYLLAGLIFAVLYIGLDRLVPGSLGQAGAAAGEPLTLDTSIYFSYVTLATLGYGDIVPHEGAARGLAVVEALGAQLYLTVMVARLVGLHAQAARPPQ
jgi:hypothetical protein